MNIKKGLKEYWQLILILALTLVIGVWRLDSLITIGGDLGQDLEAIREISGGNLTLLGPKIAHIQSTSFYLGPAYYYIQLPFVLLTGFDPIGTAIPIILARILTTILVYLITIKIFGKSQAIFAAIIAALSPYWVDKLGYPSYPYLVLPIASAIIYIIISSRYKFKKNTKTGPLFLVIVGFLSGLFTHLHYLALSIFLPALIFSYPKINFKQKILFSSAGFLAAVLPQIIFEIRNNFFLTGQFSNLLSLGLFSKNSNRLALNLNESFNFLIYYSTGFKSTWVVSLALIVLAIFLVIKIIPKKSKFTGHFFALTILVNILGAALYFGKTQPHYLAAVYPMAFIITAAAIAQTKKIHKTLPYLLILIVALFLFKGNDLYSSGGHTMPEDLSLKEMRTIARIIASDDNGQSFNVASTLDGDSRALPYRYLLKTYDKNPQNIENYDKIQNLYVVTRDPARSIRQNQLFEISSFQPSNIENSWEINGDIRLHKLTKNPVSAQSQKNFVVIANPIRPRHLWFDKNIESLSGQIRTVSLNKLPASWLTSYDNLFDPEIITVLKNLGAGQEVGAFLEVSEKLATDSRVSYKVADGDYYRPDKVFLSGYSPHERAKIIKTYLKKFKIVFGDIPQTAGSWYFDSFSLDILASHGVKSTLVVSDQYDTDAARIWGQYFAFPYYPSKYNSLEPANNQSSKIPIVQLQWAQRDPVLSYGRDIVHSRQSFQANDYLNNKFDSSYFNNLLEVYLNNSQTPFNQITVGLEVGQEGLRFKNEFNTQIETIAKFQSRGKLRTVNAGDFSNWYQSTYPGVSPSHFLEKEGSFWYMSPYFRLFILKEGQNYYISDLRYYNDIPSFDYFYKDENQFLNRVVPAVIDQVDLANRIKLNIVKIESFKESFDRLTIYADNKEVKITNVGVFEDGRIVKTAPNLKFNQNNKLTLIKMINFVKNLVAAPLNLFKYSKINNVMVLGINFSGDKMLAVNGTKVGIYTFGFQSLSKFKSPSQFYQNWQPWIN